MDQSSLFDKSLLSFNLTGVVLRCRFVSHMNDVLGNPLDQPTA